MFPAAKVRTFPHTSVTYLPEKFTETAVSAANIRKIPPYHERYGGFFCDYLGDSCASRTYKLKARRADETTGRRWSEAKPLCETPANKRNPDGVTEQTLLFLPPRRGCRPHQRNKQGLHPCLCSVRPFGTFSAPITAVAAPRPSKESPRRSPLPSRGGAGVGSVFPSVSSPAVLII